MTMARNPGSRNLLASQGKRVSERKNKKQKTKTKEDIIQSGLLSVCIDAMASLHT